MDELDPKFDAEADYRYALWDLMSGADWRVRPGSGAPIVDLAASPHWQEPNAMRRLMRGQPSGGHEILGRVGQGRGSHRGPKRSHKPKHAASDASTVGFPCPVAMPSAPASTRPGATLSTPSSVGRGGGGGGGHGGGGHHGGGHAFRAPHFPGLHMGPALPHAPPSFPGLHMGPALPHAPPSPATPHAGPLPPAAPFHPGPGPHGHGHHHGRGWGWGWGGWGPWGWVAWTDCPYGWGWQEQEDGSYLCVELIDVPAEGFGFGSGRVGAPHPPPHGGGGHGHGHAFGWHHGHGGHGGGVDVRDVRDWWGGEPVVLVPCADGTVMLPDGTCVDVSALGYEGAAVMTGQAVAPSSTSADTTGPSVPNWGMPSGDLGAAAGTSGPASSGNADVDTLAAQYIAIGQVIAQNAATAPADMQPAWARDDGQWQGWLTDYDNANAISKAARRASLSAWQSIANDWTQAVKAQWPSSAAAQALTGGQASPIGVYPSQPVAPGGGLNIPGLPSLSTVAWVVVAVLVGVGVWMLWPVIAGGHAAAGAIAG